MTYNSIVPLINYVRQKKPELQTGRAYCCSVAIKNGNILAIGFNSYLKIHPYHKFGHYKSYKGSDNNWVSHTHAEINLLKKIMKWSYEFNKITIVNIRIDNNDNVNMARPCVNCYNVLSKYKFKKIVYTIKENEIGIINF